MNVRVSISDLFNRSHYRRSSADFFLESHRDQRELFAVATVALAMKHEPRFGRHILSKLSGKPEDGNLEEVEVALQPCHHADLVIRDPARGRLFVVEFKFHSLLQAKQNPHHAAFSEHPSGYGYQIANDPSYAEFPKKHYTVIQKARDFDQRDSMGIDCRSLAWHDLDVKLYSMGGFVDDALDSLGEMGIPSLRFRKLNSMNRAQYTAEAVDMHQICEAIAAELQINKKKYDWEIGRDGISTWYGMHLPLGVKLLAKLEALAGKEEGPWGWYGYEAEDGQNPNLAFYIYTNSSEHASRTLEYLKARLLEASGYALRQSSETDIVVTAEAGNILDEKNWFSRTVDLLIN